MKSKRFLLLLALPMLALAGCGKDGTEPQTPGTNDTGAIKFEIGFAGQDGTQTRVATGADFNSEWEDGDKIGIFAVEHGQTLAASDNPIHNVPLTYNKAAGTWSGEAYWPDGVDMLDFYACYPYSAAATDPTAITFTVKTDQSGTTDSRSNYNLSDLLTARSSNGGAGWAEGAPVSLSFSHELAMVQLTIDEAADGIDFDKDVTVTLQGVKTANTLNLSAGLLLADGTAGDVTMHLAATDGTKRLYRALVPAQIVAAGAKLFRIENGDQKLTSDALTAEMTLTASTAELFTLSTGGGDSQTIIPASLTGIDAPATGAAPDTSGDDTDEYTVTSIEWSDNNGVFTGSAFAGGTRYAAEITLTAKAGWQFDIDPGITDNIEKLLAWAEYLDDFVFVGSGTTFTIVGDYSETSYTTVTFRVLLPATAAPVDDTPPTVVSIVPVGGAADVPTSGNIVITFSEPMDATSGRVQISKASDPQSFSEKSGSWSEGNTVCTVAYSGLDGGTEYVVNVLNSFKDVAGNALAQDSNSSTSFTTVVLKTITPAYISESISWPIGGRSPVYTVQRSDYEGFTVDRNVVWYSYTSDPFTGEFIPNVWYSAVIRLRAKPGFVFGDGWSYFEKFMTPAQELSGLEATDLLRVTGNSPTGTNDTEIEMRIGLKAFKIPTN